MEGQGMRLRHERNDSPRTTASLRKHGPHDRRISPADCGHVHHYVRRMAAGFAFEVPGQGCASFDKTGSPFGVIRRFAGLAQSCLPTISELLSRAFFWITWLAFALVGISVLGIPVLHEQISRLFEVLPEIFVAILILFVG